MEIIRKVRKLVSIEDSHSGSLIRLRFGEPSPGRTRFVYLTSSEARILGYALLTAAERQDSNERSKLNDKYNEALETICKKLKIDDYWKWRR
jgi:hypothetical protein